MLEGRAWVLVGLADKGGGIDIKLLFACNAGSQQTAKLHSILQGFNNMQTKSILAIAAYAAVVFALATPVVQTEHAGKEADSAFAQRSVDTFFLPIGGGGNRNANGGNGNSGNNNNNRGSGSNGNIGNGGSVQ
ncbi:hypothetical protein AB1N83_006662 [Pleurotus pulmonarius]